MRPIPVHRMAEADPRTVTGLARNLDIELRNLQLNCVYCTQHLSRRDLYKQIEKSIRVVWRGGFPYGVCSRCLVFNQQIAAWRRHSRSAYVCAVEADEGRPLGDILVRCVICLTPLNALEKVMMVARHRRFHKIGSNWRGLCETCASNPAVENAVNDQTALETTRQAARLRRGYTE